MFNRQTGEVLIEIDNIQIYRKFHIQYKQQTQRTPQNTKATEPILTQPKQDSKINRQKNLQIQMNRHKNYSQVQQTLMSTLTHGLIQKQNEGVRCMRYGYNSTNLNQFNGAGNCNGGNTVNNQNIGSINNRYQIFSRVVDNKNNCNTNKELQYGQKSTNLDPKMIKIGLNNSYQHTNPIGNRSLNSGNPRSNQKQKQKMLHRINSTITSFHQHNVLNKHNHKNNQQTGYITCALSKAYNGNQNQLSTRTVLSQLGSVQQGNYQSSHHHHPTHVNTNNNLNSKNSSSSNLNSASHYNNSNHTTTSNTKFTIKCPNADLPKPTQKNESQAQNQAQFNRGSMNIKQLINSIKSKFKTKNNSRSRSISSNSSNNQIMDITTNVCRNKSYTTNQETTKLQTSNKKNTASGFSVKQEAKQITSYSHKNIGSNKKKCNPFLDTIINITNGDGKSFNNILSANNSNDCLSVMYTFSQALYQITKRIQNNQRQIQRIHSRNGQHAQLQAINNSNSQPGSKYKQIKDIYTLVRDQHIIQSQYNKKMNEQIKNIRQSLPTIKEQILKSIKFDYNMTSQFGNCNKFAQVLNRQRKELKQASKSQQETQLSAKLGELEKKYQAITYLLNTKFSLQTKQLVDKYKYTQKCPQQQIVQVNVQQQIRLPSSPGSNGGKQDRKMVQNQYIYYIDLNGYLLDQNKYYIVDQSDNMIRVCSNVAELQQIKQKCKLVKFVGDQNMHKDEQSCHQNQNKLISKQKQSINVKKYVNLR